MLMKFAHVLYRLTPFPGVRRLYFSTYARLVRHRRRVFDVDGLRYDLDLGELIDLAVYLGKFEPDVVSVIERCCARGMSVLDIGANIGAHTLRFAKLVGEDGQVYAFEPTTFAFSKLVRNVSLNPHLCISPFRLALSDEAPTSRSISFRASWRTDGSHTDASCDADFIRLDEWAAKEGVGSVDLIKLDVDGNEYGVLAGGVGILQHFRPTLIIEAGEYHFRDRGTNPFHLLAELGYRFWDLSLKREYRDLDEILRSIQPEGEPMKDSINLVAKASN